MSVAPFLLPRPLYTINNVISVLISSKEDMILRSIVEVLFPLTIFLDNYVEQIYNKKKGESSSRSLGDEQAGAYEMLAGRVGSQFGLDGRACLQRFMCEMQQHPIDKRTMMGKLLTLLLTPRIRTKREAEVLQDYSTARKLGQSGAYCDHHYGSCPISVFRYFDDLRNMTSPYLRR